MRNLFLVIGIGITSFLSANAQSAFYVGPEIGPTLVRYSLTETGNQLDVRTLLNGNWGFSLGYELSKKVAIETGLVKTNYSFGEDYTGVRLYSSSSTTELLLIPLRITGRYFLIEDKVFFKPVLGYVNAINSGASLGGRSKGTSFVNQSDSITVTGHYSVTSRKYLPMIQAGIGIDFIILKRILLGFGADFYKGFSKLTEHHISYNRWSKGSGTGTYSFNGSFLAFNISAAYRFGLIRDK